MKTPALAALAALVVLSACSGVRQSAINPFNWFGGERSTEVTLAPEGGFPAPVDGRPTVAEITDMAVEPAQGGAIVRATGLPPTQGWWDAELRPLDGRRPEAVDGELTLRFVLSPPRQTARQGTPTSREVSAGIFVPASVLAQTARVTVIAERNARSVTRR
ncbi:MAG: hypothetical protein ACXIU8_01815 [Alkalilacustris sp.]